MSRHRAREARHPVRRALGRGAFWLVRVAVVVAVAVALAPVTLVAAGTFACAWWRGAPPRRAYLAALWCLPMVGAWLAAVAAWPASAADSGPWWYRGAAAPYLAWDAMWRLAGHGHPLAGAVAAAPPAIPLGLVAGGACWAYRRFRMRSGAGGLTPESPGAFDARQWRHQVRAAQALIAAPGSLPLLSRGGHVVAGATIRAVGPGAPQRRAA